MNPARVGDLLCEPDTEWRPSRDCDNDNFIAKSAGNLPSVSDIAASLRRLPASDLVLGHGLLTWRKLGSPTTCHQEFPELD